MKRQASTEAEFGLTAGSHVTGSATSQQRQEEVKNGFSPGASRGGVKSH